MTSILRMQAVMTILSGSTDHRLRRLRRITMLHRSPAAPEVAAQMRARFWSEMPAARSQGRARLGAAEVAELVRRLSRDRAATPAPR